jgi:hypothetical protein
MPKSTTTNVCILYYIMLLQWWKSIFYGAETVIYKRGRFSDYHCECRMNYWINSILMIVVIDEFSSCYLK